MRCTTTLVLATALWAAGPAAAAEPRAPYDPRAAFAEADTNHDGSVDHEEFHARIVEVFYAADRDKDGFLSVEELEVLPLGGDLAKADRNGDGKLSLREFYRLRFADYDDADQDGDEVLSVDEVVGVFERRGR
jgi:Ca2+-binding EF-hand superfamily protein